MGTHKYINFIQFAFTYLGCFLGVGYVSGKELWEFFGSFGICGYIGLLISSVLLFLFGFISTEVANLSKKQTIDEIIAIQNNKFIKQFILFITYSSMYAIFVIMTAGAGTIFNDIFGIDKILGSLIFALIILVSVICGIYKVVRILTIVIPILVCVSIFICAKTLNTYHIVIRHENINNNPLLSNWLSSSIIYLSTNALAALGTILTIAPIIKNRKHSILGSLVTAIILFFVGTVIILTVSTMPLSMDSDLPMLYVSMKLSDNYGLLYSILLLFGMFSAAIGNTTALSLNLKEKIFNSNKHSLLVSVFLICISGVIISNFGFSGLIKSVYPILGYFGIPIIFLIIFKYIYLKHNQ